ncbi:MAG: molecular chaperone TorD family protein [Deltaproteobacteria bacterium]|nr:molecular chaperone TorD family protein [Deltaproteobacteria bacterium]
MKIDSKLYERLGSLFVYPGNGYGALVALAQERLHEVQPDVMLTLEPFARWVGTTRVEEIQEHFTATFDMNPSACLEVGWHLFGESYARGDFLVSMRGLMRRLGVPESAELPDHLSHVLQVLGRLPAQEAAPLAARVLRAIDKMIAGQPESSPTRALVAAVRDLVAAACPEGRTREKGGELDA